MLTETSPTETQEQRLGVWEKERILATQKDVAARAGVSFITVSRVVNGLGNVKESTRRKVEEAIRELKYYPNSMGKALNQGKTGTIGLVTPIRMHTHLGADNFLIGLMDGIEQRCNERHFDLLLSVETHPEKGEDLLRLYHKRKVDGIIFIGFQKIPGAALEEITSDQIPCVVVADRPGTPGIPWIDTDNYAAGREAVSRLAGAGARRIGFITVDTRIVTNFNVTQRWEGGRDEAAGRGLELRDSWCFKVPSLGEDTGKAAFEAWAAQGPDRPDGLVCGTDELGMGFAKEAIRRGVPIPGEVRLVGFDALPEGQWFQPSLATFKQPLGTIGYEAARILELKIDRLLAEADSHRIYPLDFVPGKTLG